MSRSGREHRQNLVDLIRKTTYRHAAWRIWDDLMYMGSTSLAQAFTYSQEREDEYLKRIGKYDKETQSLFPQLFAEIVMAFEQEGCTDILGSTYMDLNLSSHWHGQYFTPSHICDFMAKIVGVDISAKIDQSGYITVNDPCCGGGAMLIAYAKSVQEQGINYQNDVLFVGQDIDSVVARMAFISMSLLGMPGYVIIGDTLRMETRDVMYTPFYFISGFPWRRKRNNTNHEEEQLDLGIFAPASAASVNASKTSDLEQTDLIF